MLLSRQGPKGTPALVSKAVRVAIPANRGAAIETKAETDHIEVVVSKVGAPDMLTNLNDWAWITIPAPVLIITANKVGQFDMT